MSRTSSRKSRAPSGSSTVLLQFCEAAPIVEVRTRGEDAGDASRVGESTAVVSSDIHGRGGREAYFCRWNCVCVKPKQGSGSAPSRGVTTVRE